MNSLKLVCSSLALIGVAAIVPGCSKAVRTHENEVIVSVPQPAIFSKRLVKLNDVMASLQRGPATRKLKFEFQPSAGLQEVVASRVYVLRGSVTFYSQEGFIQLLPENKVVTSAGGASVAEPRQAAGDLPAVVFGVTDDDLKRESVAFQKINVWGGNIQNTAQRLGVETRGGEWVVPVTMELSEDFQGALTNWIVRVGKQAKLPQRILCRSFQK